MPYLDSASTSGVISVAKFQSFAQQTEQNTSIATDGDYLYIYAAVPSKAMLYKIGTGATEATVPGKIYLERKAERDGDVAWTYCQGKLYARRASEEFGLLTVYDASNLQTIGDARLMCTDVFAASKAMKMQNIFPIMSNGSKIYAVTMKIEQRRRPVRPEMQEKFAELQARQKEETEKKPSEAEGGEKANAKPPEQSSRRRDIERKLQEMQAREEDLIMKKSGNRGKPMNKRGGIDTGRGGRSGRGDYGGRGGRGGRVPPDPRRFQPPEESVEFKLDGEKNPSTD